MNPLTLIAPPREPLGVLSDAKLFCAWIWLKRVDLDRDLGLAVRSDGSAANYLKLENALLRQGAELLAVPHGEFNLVLSAQHLRQKSDLDALVQLCRVARSTSAIALKISSELMTRHPRSVRELLLEIDHASCADRATSHAWHWVHPKQESRVVGELLPVLVEGPIRTLSTREPHDSITISLSDADARLFNATNMRALAKALARVSRVADRPLRILDCEYQQTQRNHLNDALALELTGLAAIERALYRHPFHYLSLLRGATVAICSQRLEGLAHLSTTPFISLHDHAEAPLDGLWRDFDLPEFCRISATQLDDLKLSNRLLAGLEHGFPSLPKALSNFLDQPATTPQPAALAH